MAQEIGNGLIADVTGAKVSDGDPLIHVEVINENADSAGWC
jgi:hypothetical protein